jgi:hypothetical protein
MNCIGPPAPVPEILAARGEPCKKPGAISRPGLDTVLKDIRLCLNSVSMSTDRKLQNRLQDLQSEFR